MNLLTTAISLGLIVQMTESATIQIIKPIRNGPEAVFIIAPGGGLGADDYIEIGTIVQTKSMLNLWIVLAPSLLTQGGFPEALQILRNSLDFSFRELVKQGFSKNSAVFLGGHSFGGVIAAEVDKTDNRITAVLLWGAFDLNDFKDFPKPLLTLTGELDGLLRVTRIVQEFEELQQIAKANKEAILEKPVIVMPGVNHGQFASTRTNRTLQLDLKSAVSNETAYNVIAKHTTAFIEFTLRQPKSDVEANKQMLQRAFQNTKRLLQPFLNLKMLDDNSRKVSMWTKTAQRITATPKPLYGKEANIRIQNIVVDKELLEQTSANAKRTGRNSLILNTVTAVIQPMLNARVTTGPQTPIELAVKLIHFEALKNILPKLKFPRKTTCRDVNHAAFKLALNTASIEAKERALTRLKTVPVFFKPDTVVSNQNQWINETLIIERNHVGIDIKSIAFKLETSNKMNGTQLFCKLLSPYRAIEIIYIDLLRNTF